MRLLILGANSDIAKAIAEKFALEESADLYLASRNMERLQAHVNDLEIRYNISAEPLFFDATDYKSHREFYENLDPKPDGVIVAFGYLGNQDEAQKNFQEAKKIMETNYIGAVSILEIIAGDFERSGSGFIIGISSVAGDRGRKANYLYGSAKAGFTTYLSGLRNRLHKYNIFVMTVKPGFVDTKMVSEIETNPLLTIRPSKLAKKIHDCYRKKRNNVYSTYSWRILMFFIKALPDTLFKRTNI